jgi:hypothetical protein
LLPHVRRHVLRTGLNASPGVEAVPGQANLFAHVPAAGQFSYETAKFASPDEAVISGKRQHLVRFKRLGQEKKLILAVPFRLMIELGYLSVALPKRYVVTFNELLGLLFGEFIFSLANSSSSQKSGIALRIFPSNPRMYARYSAISVPRTEFSAYKNSMSSARS